MDVSVDIEELVLWLFWHWVSLMAGQGASYVRMYVLGGGGIHNTIYFMTVNLNQLIFFLFLFSFLLPSFLF